MAVCFRTHNTFDNFSKWCEGCSYYLLCAKHLLEENGTYKLVVPRDTVVNDFGKNRTEIIIYKKHFQWLADYENYSLDLTRNFKPIDDEKYGRLLLPLTEDARMSTLLSTLEDTSARAQDNFYGYALSNQWKYFFTYTFDKTKVDRYDDDEVISLWSTFRRKAQREDPDIKILAIKERHEDGALHFHGLMNTDKDFLLKPHYDKNGVWKLSKCGDPLFEFDLWNYGLHTLAVLPKDGNHDRVVNYMITYVTKQGNTGFGKKRFFRTHNLKFKEHFITNSTEARDIIAAENLEVYKDTDKFTVYRNFNNAKKDK
jgi:hypothetical protein